MIVRWRSVGPVEFVARYQDMDLALRWDTAEHKWCVTVDGSRVKERWTSAAGAIDAVEAALDRLLGRMAGEVRARQRPLSLAVARA